MKLPKGGGGLNDACAKRLFSLYKIPWVQFFLAPLLFTLPPVLLTKFTDSQKFHDFVSADFPQLAEFLDRYYLASILFATIYTIAVLAFAKSIVRRVRIREIDTSGLLSIIAALDGIVGPKAARFGEHVKNIPNLTRETIFCTISQPQLQIVEIIRSLWYLFDAAKSRETNNLIRVVLARFADGKIIGFPVYFPADEFVDASLDDLNKPNSAFSTAFRTKKILVIPDIEKELRTKKRYEPLGNHDDDSGSLICYPVIHKSTREVPFVISIHCDEKNYFKQDNEFVEIYKLTLERFALRLSVEYSLLLLKETICEQNN